MNRCDRQLRRQVVKQQAAGIVLAKVAPATEEAEDKPQTQAQEAHKGEVTVSQEPGVMPPLDRLRTPTTMSCDYLLKSYTRSLTLGTAACPPPRMLGRALAGRFRAGAGSNQSDINSAIYGGVVAAASNSTRAAHCSGGERRLCLEGAAGDLAASVDLWTRAEEVPSPEEGPPRKQTRVEKTHPALDLLDGADLTMRPVEMLRHCKYLFGTGKARRDIDEPYLFFDKKLKRVRGDDRVE